MQARAPPHLNSQTKAIFKYLTVSCAPCAAYVIVFVFRFVRFVLFLFLYMKFVIVHRILRFYGYGLGVSTCSIVRSLHECACTQPESRLRRLRGVSLRCATVCVPIIFSDVVESHTQFCVGNMSTLVRCFVEFSKRDVVSHIY